MLAHLASSAQVLHAAIIAATSTPTTTVAKAKAGADNYIIIVLLVLVVGYFAFMRPRSRARMQQQQAQARTLEVGDEVATNAGIVGRVRRISDDRVELEIAPGMRIQVLRQNLGRPLQSDGFGGSSFDSSGSFDNTARNGLDGGSGSGGYGDDPGWDDGDDDSTWSGNDAGALAPGGERDVDNVPASASSTSGGATRPAGARASRNRPRRPRPAVTTSSDERPPGWSLTSEGGGDDGAGDSTTAGTSS